LGNDGLLIFAVILSLVCIGTYNLFGQIITKYINAVTRAILNVLRTIIIWIVGIIITVSTDSQWEILTW